MAIMLLALAIIPMVSMFDAGLRAVGLSGNYDKARALAGKQLALANSKPYTQVKDNFPVTPSTPNEATGIYESASLTDAEFPGLTYKVRKEYVALEGNSIQPGATARSLKRMMRVTITVTWSRGL